MIEEYGKSANRLRNRVKNIDFAEDDYLENLDVNDVLDSLDDSWNYVEDDETSFFERQD